MINENINAAILEILKANSITELEFDRVFIEYSQESDFSEKYIIKFDKKEIGIVTLEFKNGNIIIIVQIKKSPNKMNGLKPCPFCGSKAILKKVRGGYKTSPTTISDEWKVSCEKGCCSCGTFQDIIYHSDNGEIIVECNGAKKAVEAWNKRAYGSESNEFDERGADA